MFFKICVWIKMDLSLCLSCNICYSCPHIPSLLLQH
ncbi:hypothetical protein ACJW30_03G044300 [Castanea mollissima]